MRGTRRSDDGEREGTGNGRRIGVGASHGVVERAAREAEEDTRARTAGSARSAAAARVRQLHASRGLRRFAFENGLSLAAFGLFLISFVGQIVVGAANYNAERRDHGQSPLSIAAYLRTGAFVEATAENWESEFLQMGVFVLLTAWLYQRGSSESKPIEEPAEVDQDPAEARDDPDAPAPVRRGGAVLALYRHSLSLVLLALFAVSLALHATGGAREYSEEQRQHGGAPVSALGYLATSRFWFESFQNWQSEFLSVGVLVVLTIWLRERGSPQSKPVASRASDAE
jgi:hypothetical protein